MLVMENQKVDLGSSKANNLLNVLPCREIGIIILLGISDHGMKYCVYKSGVIRFNPLVTCSEFRLFKTFNKYKIFHGSSEIWILCSSGKNEQILESFN